MQFFCSSLVWQVVWKNVIELPIVTIAVSRPVQNAINLKTCVKVSTEHLQLPNDKIHLTVNGRGTEVNLFVFFFCRQKKSSILSLTKLSSYLRQLRRLKPKTKIKKHFRV
jgi:hypothetical protein